MGKRLFFSAATETQAVIEAAARLGVPADELAYRTRNARLRQGRVVIEVDPAEPRREAPVAAVGEALRPERLAREPRPSSAPVRGAAEGRGGQRAEPAGGVWITSEEPLPLAAAERVGAAAGALLRLGRLDAEAAVEVLPTLVTVDLRGEGRAALLARGAERLHACEYLLRRMVRELPEDGLMVDCDGYRAERERELRERAATAAERVRRSGEAVLFEPLPPGERRWIHLQVQDEEGVSSASEGNGEERRVRLFPA